MMTIRQYYLNKLAEECAEISQVVSKQMQFGKDMRWAKGAGEDSAVPSNAEKLRAEVNDLLGVLDVLMDINELPEISPWELLEAKNAKRRKMAKFLVRSQVLGQVENIDRPIGLKIHDIHSIEPEPDATGECQAWYGADDVCGLPPNSPIHQPGGTHNFVLAGPKKLRLGGIID